jgi:TP901 family phage tail tape measure protein
MADNLDARARLSISVEGLKELVGEMDRAVQSGNAVDKVWDKLQKGLSGAKTEAKGAAAGLKQAGDEAKGATTKWDKLDEKVRGVAAAYKLAAREAAAAGKAAPDATAFASKNGVSGGDLAAHKAGRSADFFGATDPSKLHSALPSLRYALYDVATTAGIASTAITGVGVAATVAFASMESSFTNVERTLDNVSSGQVQELRKELVGLTREIPQSFANISEISTLGNQLGIQAGDIAKFTEVTAKFSAVTGLTAEASAQAFGSLGQLLHVSSDQYESLGSAIALVGRKSVATEAEIVAMTTRLAASATNAGFTAQQVIALSGAFASLRIAPERAQGVMEIYFNRLNTAINEGGPRLEAFAQIAGVTADQVQTLVQTDPVGFFEKLSKGLGSMNQQAQTGALEQLGLDGIRAGEVFGRISANVDVFDKALQDANQGWAEATELGSQYAKVLDDLASRWQIFLNALQEAGAAVGDALAPVIGAALAVLTDLLQKFSDFAATPFGAWAVRAVALVGGIAAALTGLVAALALTSASFLAIRFALTEFATMAGVANAGAMTLSGTMSALAGTTTVASGAMRLFRGALMATGIGAILLLLVSLAADFNGTMLTMIDVMEWLHGATGGLFLPLENLSGILFGLASVFGVSADQLQAFADAMSNVDIGQVLANQSAEFGNFLADIGNFFVGLGTAIYDFFNGMAQTLSGGAAGLGQIVKNMLGPAFGPIMSFLNDVANAINSVLSRFSQGFSIGTGAIDMGGLFDGMRAQFGGAGKAVSGFNNLAVQSVRKVQSARLATDGFSKSLGGIGGGPGGKGGSAGGAAKAVRTLVDYANDLSGVFKRAFDIRFGNQQGLDSITSGWRKIAEESADAREEMAKYRATLAELSADRKIKEYWLSVAKNYGDTLRAAKLRAELAELDNDQAKAQKDLSKAQDKTNKTLTGNSDAAIENRDTILGMVGSYQDLLKTYAANGMSQEDLKRKAAQLKAEFIAQATQAGFSRVEITRYAAAFDDMAVAVQRVPRNITVAANVNPALQALAEFEAKAKTAGRNAANSIRSGGGGGYGIPTIRPTVVPRVDMNAAEKAGLAAGRAIRSKIIAGISVIKIGNKTLTAPGADLYGHSAGGYTGNGGVNEPAHFVHGKEYVMSAPAVRTLGVNGMNYMHNMLKSGRIPTMGGGSGAGGMVELSPYDRQLLIDIKNSAGLTIGAQTIQATTNGYNANMAQRRSA